MLSATTLYSSEVNYAGDKNPRTTETQSKQKTCRWLKQTQNIMLHEHGTWYSRLSRQPDKKRSRTVFVYSQLVPEIHITVPNPIYAVTPVLTLTLA